MRPRSRDTTNATRQVHWKPQMIAETRAAGVFTGGVLLMMLGSLAFFMNVGGEGVGWLAAPILVGLVFIILWQLSIPRRRTAPLVYLLYLLFLLTFGLGWLALVRGARPESDVGAVYIVIPNGECAFQVTRVQDNIRQDRG